MRAPKNHICVHITYTYHLYTNYTYAYTYAYTHTVITLFYLYIYIYHFPNIYTHSYIVTYHFPNLVLSPTSARAMRLPKGTARSPIRFSKRSRAAELATARRKVLAELWDPKRETKS